jgi:hypothetical protein
MIHYGAWNKYVVPYYSIAHNIIVNKFYWDMQHCLSLSENQPLPSLRYVKGPNNALQSKNNTCAMSILEIYVPKPWIVHFLEIIEQRLWQYMCINYTKTRNVVCPRAGIIHCQVWGMWLSATIHNGALAKYVKHLLVLYFQIAQCAISSWSYMTNDVQRCLALCQYLPL